jgi:hypothetical protein
MAVYDADAFVEGIEEEQREEIRNAEAVQTDDPNQDATVVQEPATPPPPEATAQEQIQEAAAEAQPQQADEGIITQGGEWIQKNLIQGGLVKDAVNAAAAGLNQITPEGPLKGITQGIDDFVLSQDEINANMEQQIKERGESDDPAQQIRANVLSNLMGIERGSQAGVMAPATIAGRVAGQDTPWSRAPEILKDHPMGDTLFQLTEVLVPTLLTAGVAGPVAGPVGLIGESALETALQDNTDDLIAGRTIAANLGQLADYLGYDGAEVTRDLIEGRKPEAVVMMNVVGFMQNLGINFGANKVMAKFFPNAVSDEAVAAAKLSPDGKDVKAVQEALDDVQEPPYRADYEPHEVMDVDSQVMANRPSAGNTYVSTDALRAELLRKNGLGEDGLTAANRHYFSNYKSLSDNIGIQRTIDEVTKGLEMLPDFSEDLGRVVIRASEWWNANKSLIDDNIGDLVQNFAKADGGMVRAVDEKWAISGEAYSGSIKSNLRDKLGTTASGNIVAAIIGEEMGVRIQKNAMAILNLDEAGIDFTQQMDNFIALQDTANNFFVPLRRSKRQWATEGYSQQRGTINQLKDANVKSSRIKPEDASIYGPGRDFETIKMDEDDVGATMAELWDKAKGGDADALDTLKAYVGYIAYADPKSVMSQVDNLGGQLAKDLLKGTTSGIGKLHYASMLSRVATQVVSISSGLIRTTFEPVSLIVDSLARRDKDTLFYGLGQFWGGMVHMQDHMNVVLKSFKENKPINPGTKFSRSYADLRTQQLDLDRNYKGALREYEKLGKDTTPLTLSYLTQMAAINPQVQGPMRMLMASDEGFKSVAATQHATGRAWRRIAQEGAYLDEAKKAKILNEEFKRVYSEGIQTGKITDAEVLEDAKMLSFQRDIHTDRAGWAGGNLVDGAFNQLHEASSRNGLFRVFQPFARISWDVNEQSLITFGGSTPLSRWGVAQMPRYKAIINGTDDVAKIRMRSMLAAGQLTAMSAVGLAMTGNITGFNSGGQPRQSIRIPGTDKWISYARLEPYAATLSIIADAVNSFKYGAISRQEYSKVLSEMTMTFGLAFTDKTMFQGMFQMSRLLQIKNYNEKSGSTVADFLGGFSPAVLRMVAEKVQPYKTIGSGENAIEDSVAAFSRRAFGGIGLPIHYDSYTGKPIPRTGTMSDPENYGAAVGSAMLQEFVPGRVVTYDPKDPIKNYMKKVGFKIDEATGLKKYKGQRLSGNEQSILSKDMYDYGKLGATMKRFTTGEGARLWNKYEKLMARSGKGDTPEENEKIEARKERTLNTIKQRLRDIHIDAKERAIMEGRLGKDPDFRNKMLDKFVSQSESLPAYTDQDETNPAMNLINWMNGSQQTA